MPVSRAVVAALMRAVATPAGVCCGFRPRNRAATPATWGEAIDVPLKVAVPVLLAFDADVMAEPGANRSTQVPKFENDARASVLVEAPAVRARGTRAGEPLQALALELPAATANVTPAVMALLTALSRAVEAPPPRLM